MTKNMDGDRDRTIEKLLGDALETMSTTSTTSRTSARAASSSCLDAETAAAWADGALGATERAAVERHVASCDRCQTLVAALVRTAPPAQTRASFLPSGFRAWLAPLGALTAAAAAAVLWAVAPASKQSAPSTATAPPAAVVAGDEQRPAGRADSAAAKEGPPPEQQIAAAPQESRQKTAASSFADRPADRRLDARDNKAAAKKDVDEEQSKLKNTVDSLAAPPPLAAVAPPPPPEPKREAPAGRGGRVQDAVGGVAGGGAGNAAAASPVPPPAAASADRAASPVPPPAAASADRAAALQKSSVAESVTVTGAAPLQPRRSTLPTIVASPDRTVQWRIVNPFGNGAQRNRTTIEHSTDGGATWHELAPAANTFVTAGAAPSPDVCWLVGPVGTVLLTTTGLAWTRIAFPEAVDLTAVRATDGRNATVTAADGRTFTTTDGGATWTISR